jgi:hypothetical protein
MMIIDAPLLENLDFSAISFVPMDHEFYWFEHGDPGEQAVFRLHNDLLISLVRHRLSMGGDRGQYEAMVFTETQPEGAEVKGITDSDGIVGYLEPRDVTELLIKLAGV